MATHRAGQLGGEAPGVQFSLRHGALLLSWGSVSLPQLRTPQSQGSWDLGPPDRGGAGSGEEPGAACQPDPRGILAPPIPGQAVGMLTPHHCPLAALPGLRWRAAPSPYILICGLGWPLPWPLPRPGACWPALGVIPPPPRWPAVLFVFTEAAGLGSGCVLGLQAPSHNHVFSSLPLSRAGAWRGLEEGGVRTAPSLLGVLHADPSVNGL